MKKLENLLDACIKKLKDLIRLIKLLKRESRYVRKLPKYMKKAAIKKLPSSIRHFKRNRKIWSALSRNGGKLAGAAASVLQVVEKRL